MIGKAGTADSSRRPDLLGVVVLGMGRSGTSAVAGMFVEAGFFAGREGDVLLANDSNPGGHHENLGVLRTNERVLRELVGWWHDPPPVENQLAASQRLAPTLRSEIQRMELDAHGTPIVVKDPRIGVLMPLWAPVLADCLHPVLVIRDPIEIALSLRARDGTPVPFGLAIWELHMTTLLDYLNDRLVTVAPYPSLVDDSSLAERIVRAAAAHIDTSRTRDIRPNAAGRALKYHLRHNTASGGDRAELLTSRQLELWQLLRSLPAGDEQIEVPAHLCSSTRNSRDTVRCETNRILEYQEHSRRLERLEAQLADAHRAIARATAETQSIAAEHKALHENYLRVINSRRWRVMNPPARVITGMRRLKDRRLPADAPGALARSRTERLDMQ